LLATLLAVSALAQNPPPQVKFSKLPVDHPILHDTFFKAASGLEGMHAQRKTQVSGAQLQQVDRDFARVFKIHESELERMFQITRAASAEIKAVENQMRNHANERARLELHPDRATMQRLQEQRQSVIQFHMARLRTTLSAAGWNALSNYINTTTVQDCPATLEG